jgi:manganese transport protein
LIDKLRGLLKPGAPAEIHPQAAPGPIAAPSRPPLRRVAVALDFSGREEKLLAEALRFLGQAKPDLALLHVVESPSARAFGRDAADRETRADADRLETYAAELRELGFATTTALGAGQPARELARLVEEFGAELVILGGHGHRGLSDMVHGTTAEALRHRVKASVLVIPLAE